MNMLQQHLYAKVNKSTIDTLPRTLMLLGEFGCGKHTLVKYISEKFNLEIEDISLDLTLELIDDISNRVEPKIYLIESSSLTIRSENVILKFLEEPLKNAFIIVLAENKHSIIPTVLNRCQVWEFEGYSKEYLSTLVEDMFEDNSLLLEVANTPGKIEKYKSYPIVDMVNLANKIFRNIKNANFANALTLSRHIAFKNEKDKYDFSLFLDILLKVSKDLCKENFDKCYNIYSLTNKLNNNKYVFNVDKKALFDNYIIELKLLCGGAG